MLVPCFFSNLLLRFALAFGVLHKRFLAFAVQVFAHQVQHCVDALMRVVLAISCELLGVLPENTLEEIRTDHVIGLVPHLINELCIGHHEAALSAERVLDGQLLDELVPLLEEEPCQLVGVAETLQA